MNQRKLTGKEEAEDSEVRCKASGDRCGYQELLEGKILSRTKSRRLKLPGKKMKGGEEQ